MRLGQMEYIAVVGAIVVVLVVIALALRGNIPGITLPTAVSSDEEIVQNSYSGVLSDGISAVVAEMEARGGYLSLSTALESNTASVPAATTYLGEGVPYWQVCQNNLARSTADVQRDFKFALTNYLKNHLAFSPLSGKDVDVNPENVAVDIQFLDTKVQATMTLPTKIQGRSVGSTYQASVPTEFGTIISFAQDAAKELATKRHFDEHTISAIFFSAPASDGHPIIPTGGILTECGDGFTRTPDEIGEGLTDIVSYVLVNTEWFSEGTDDPSVPKTFGIAKVNGKTYKLTVQQRLPDGTSFKGQHPVAMYASHKIFNNPTLESLGFGIPVCHGAYAYAPSLQYPYIVEVQDKLTGNAFRFAGYAAINKMQSVDCVEPKSAPVNPSCSAECPVSIRVQDGLGSPVSGAVVSYGSCLSGTTDVAGTLNGNSPCGSQQLSVYHKDYAPYFSSASADPKVITTTLQKFVPHTFSFRQASVSTSGSYTTCTLSAPTGPARATFTTPDGAVDLYNIDTTVCSSSIDQNADCSACADEAAAGTPGSACTACLNSCLAYTSSVTAPSTQYPGAVPSGTFPVSASLMQPGSGIGGTPLATVSGTATVPYTPDPVSITIPVPSGTSPAQAAADLKTSCGIDAFHVGAPYASTVYRFNQVCTCGSLGEIAAKLLDAGCAIDVSQFGSGCSVPAAKTLIEACDAQIAGAC